MNLILVLALMLCLLPAGRVLAASENCSVCNGQIERTVYFFVDRVAGDKKRVCEKCAALTTVCYLCGLPARENFTRLTDGRILCARDVKNVVLDEDEAQKAWHNVKEALARQFSRFIAFPENVTVSPLDRVDLLSMFKLSGNDQVCPNVWGLTRSQTKDNRFSHDISLLRGLPPATLKATCAHELTHAWVTENVPPARKESLALDAVEGFCELISYLYVETLNDEAQLGIIRSNGYTRGQLALFREAERQYGLNEIVDWMKYGIDAHLSSDDLGRLRNVAMPAPKSETAAAIAPAAAVAPPPSTTLILQGITWSKRRPTALINGRTFAVQEEGSVRLGPSNVLLRCLAVREDCAVIQIVGSAATQTLKLKGGGSSAP